MALIRSVCIVLALVSAFGCTSTTVRPVNNTLELKHDCIKDGQRMCFDGEMIDVIRDGFERHGLTTQIYTGNLPSKCEYHLSYMCERTWDMAMYLHHAELRLYRSQVQVGYAEYRLKGGGGFSLMKWESTKKKMDPVMDELLSGYPKKSNETVSTVTKMPNEPWTGMWEVEASLYGGIWGMKQSGKIVNSTKDSFFEFKGNVIENQLKKRMINSGLVFPFVITISFDGMSFEGNMKGVEINHFLKGTRME